MHLSGEHRSTNLFTGLEHSAVSWERCEHAALAGMASPFSFFTFFLNLLAGESTGFRLVFFV